MYLTIKQKATNDDTWKHIHRVGALINKCVKELLNRAEKHDMSKLELPEVALFEEFTPKLAESTYGSEEYNSFLSAMKPALDHHYANNRHHANHFKNGIEDMNLIDLLEMISDWKAASERHNDGNIRKSIEINANRYNISPQLTKILENTADFLFKD